MTLERTTMTMTDVVVQRPEHPQTLIEKFKAESQSYQEKSNHKLNAPVDKWIWHGMARGLEKASEIVKQHSDWISVDERLPAENDGRVSWGVNAYKKYILVNIVSRGIAMTCRFNLTDKCFETADEVTHWQPLPKPPSEVQL